MQDILHYAMPETRSKRSNSSISPSSDPEPPAKASKRARTLDPKPSASQPAASKEEEQPTRTQRQNKRLERSSTLPAPTVETVQAPAGGRRKQHRPTAAEKKESAEPSAPIAPSALLPTALPTMNPDGVRCKIQGDLLDLSM